MKTRISKWVSVHGMRALGQKTHFLQNSLLIALIMSPVTLQVYNLYLKFLQICTVLNSNPSYWKSVVWKRTLSVWYREVYFPFNFTSQRAPGCDTNVSTCCVRSQTDLHGRWCWSGRPTFCAFWGWWNRATVLRCPLQWSWGGDARASGLLTRLIPLYFNHLPAFSRGILLYTGLDRQR